MCTIDEQALVNLLQAEAPLKVAFLYGSFAKGTARKGSDIDLAVAGSEELDAHYIQALRSRISDRMNRDVDVVDLNRVNGVILRECMNGRELVCRDRALKERLMIKLVYDQEDFMPLRRRMMKERRERELGLHG